MVDVEGSSAEAAGTRSVPRAGGEVGARVGSTHMVKFGHTLAAHVQRSLVPAEHYVDYKALKKSLKRGVDEEEFQRIYAGQMQIVLDRLAAEPDTMRQDPEYVTINRTALDKISKKYDKQRSATLRAEHRSQVTSAFSQCFAELLDQGLITPEDGGLIPHDLRDRPTVRASSGWVVFVAGGCAGVISRTVTAPLNLVKMRLQTNSDPSFGMRQCFRTVMSEGGVRAFWRGNLANILKVTPESAVRFGVYEQLKNCMMGSSTGESRPFMTPTEKFVCGSTAGGVGQAIVYPLDVAKTRMAVAASGVYAGVGDCLAKTVATDGLRGLYRGLGPALASIMPVAGVDLAVFNTLKERYIAWEQKTRRQLEPLQSPEQNKGLGTQLPVQLPVPVSLGIGATAALAGGLIGYPLAVVRTRLITQHMASDIAISGRYRYTGAVDALWFIWQNEGVRGLYRGQVPSLMKSLPAISVGYGTFETIRNLLDSGQ